MEWLKIIIIIISIENLIHRIRTEAHTWPIFYVLRFGYLFKDKNNGTTQNDGRDYISNDKCGTTNT